MLLLLMLIVISVTVSSFLGTILGNFVSRKEVNIENPVKVLQQKLEEKTQKIKEVEEYEAFQRLYPKWLYHEAPEPEDDEAPKGW